VKKILIACLGLLAALIFSFAPMAAAAERSKFKANQCNDLVIKLDPSSLLQLVPGEKNGFHCKHGFLYHSSQYEIVYLGEERSGPDCHIFVQDLRVPNYDFATYHVWQDFCGQEAGDIHVELTQPPSEFEATYITEKGNYPNGKAGTITFSRK
jgi:hypothetical protein